MIVAGIGCRKGVSVDDVLAAVDGALARYARLRKDLRCLAAPALKQSEPVLTPAATALGIPLQFVDDHDLRAASPRLLTHSVASLAVTGVESASEAAALGAAGPESRLLGPRIVVGAVTCALAEDDQR